MISRSLRLAVRAAAVPALVGAALLAAPTPAYADGEWLRITPTTIQAGFQVQIEANCQDMVNNATVTSRAFGTITVPPDKSKGRHITAATIPADTRPGRYEVNLTCPNTAKAETTIWVVSMATPTRGPHTGGGALADHTNTGMMIGGGAAAVGAGVLLLAAYRRRLEA